IFNHEFNQLYEALVAGRENPLRPLKVQYADFAIWQRSAMATGAFNDGLAYWQKQLSRIAAPLRLTSKRPSEQIGGLAEERRLRLLTPQLCGELQRLGIQERASLFMVLLTSFQILLAKWSGQTDIPVGVIVANRTRPEIAKLIGCFVNVVVVRATVAP